MLKLLELLELWHTCVCVKASTALAVSDMQQLGPPLPQPRTAAACGPLMSRCRCRCTAASGAGPKVMAA
jgi:hypothetical protein